MRYAIVIEKAESNYSAYVPDLPGCVATGATVEEAESLIREAIESISRECARTAFQFRHLSARSSTSILRHNPAAQRTRRKRRESQTSVAARRWLPR